jgi:tryptophan synthase beta subunit
MALSDALDNRQAQAASACVAGGSRSVGTSVEPLEDAFALVLGNSGTIVPHYQHGAAPGLSRNDVYYATRGCVTQCVLYQVVQQD